MKYYPACVASVSVRFRSKEQGTRVKDRAKNGASKRAGRGWGRKEGNACRQTPGFWKPPHMACHAWVRASTFDAFINCHNWPIKCLAFSGAEMNFRGRVCEPNNTWRRLCWNINESERSILRLWTFVFLIRLTEQSVNHHREQKKIAFSYSD